MTTWQNSRLVLAFIFVVVGVLPFTAFTYFGYILIVPTGESPSSGHDMVLWVSLIYSFCAFLVTAILAFTLKIVISKRMLNLLLAPLLLSGMFVVGILAFQYLQNVIANNA